MNWIVRRLLLWLLGFVLLAATPKSVWAQDTELQDPLARELKASGDEAMASLRYEEALQAYERATEVEAHPVLLFNRARALQALQRYPEALDHFEAFRRDASPELLARAGKLDELVARLRAQISTLEVICNVADATVLVRGKKVGVTPLKEPLRLNAGPATISVMADGHHPYRQELELPGAGQQRIQVKLVPMKTAGRLTITSPVAGAMVSIDGKRLGVVPAETTLSDGRHRVRVAHPDFRPAETAVEVVKGESKTVDVKLERKPGLLSKWWFWTGAGVVVAGGVGLTVALTTERKASRGDIPPGTVSAPLVRF